MMAHILVAAGPERAAFARCVPSGKRVAILSDEARQPILAVLCSTI